MTKASDNAFPSLLITEGTEPSAPAAGKQRLYIDSTTHKLKRTDSSGVDVTIESTAANTFSSTIVRRTSAQSVSGSGTETAISFDTETEDTDGAWAIGTPTKIIIPSGLNGRRAVLYGQGNFAANTGGNYRHLRIAVAGAAMTPDAVCIMPDMATNATNIVVQVFSTPRTLATSEEYTLLMRIDSTGFGVDAAIFGFYTVD